MLKIICTFLLMLNINLSLNGDEIVYIAMKNSDINLFFWKDLTPHFYIGKSENTRPFTVKVTEKYVTHDIEDVNYLRIYDILRNEKNLITALNHSELGGIHVIQINKEKKLMKRIISYYEGETYIEFYDLVEYHQ